MRAFLSFIFTVALATVGFAQVHGLASASNTPDFSRTVTFNGKMTVLRSCPLTFRCEYPFNIVCYKYTYPISKPGVPGNLPCGLEETDVYIKVYDPITQAPGPWVFYRTMRVVEGIDMEECMIELN